MDVAVALSRAPSVANDAPAVATPEQVAVISGAVDCRWADASTAIEPGAAVPAGRRFVLASGLLQIWYDSRVEVILQGPAIYEADSPNGGFLSLGRLTARVEKRPQADSRGPTAPGAARRSCARTSPSARPARFWRTKTRCPAPACLGSAEFGVIVDSPDVTRVHVFRGLVTTRLAGGGPNNAMAVPLAANRSLCLPATASRGVTNARPEGQDGRRALRPPRHRPCRRPTGAAGVAQGDRQRARSENSSPSAAAKTSSCRRYGHRRERPQIPPRRRLPAIRPPGGLPSGIVYTCRLTFDLGDLSPATAMLRCDYVARNSIAAIRLNGKGIRRSQAAAAEAATAAKESGEFVIHGGLRPGFFRPRNQCPRDRREQRPSFGPAAHAVAAAGSERHPHLRDERLPALRSGAARGATTEQRGAKH